MAMPLRYFEQDIYYHVYNRGNRKQQIFLSARDYERFLKKVVEYKEKYGVNILAYCLMPNHFHFLLQKKSSDSISKFISDLCNSHSRFFNVKYETVGSLFQGRFKAKRVDKDEYAIHLSRYIHLNPLDLLNSSIPLKAEEMFDRLLNYKWSSLPLYLSESKNKIVDPTPILNYFPSKNPGEDYKNFLLPYLNLRKDPLIDHLLID